VLPGCWPSSSVLESWFADAYNRDFDEDIQQNNTQTAKFGQIADEELAPTNKELMSVIGMILGLNNPNLKREDDSWYPG